MTTPRRVYAALAVVLIAAMVAVFAVAGNLPPEGLAIQGLGR